LKPFVFLRGSKEKDKAMMHERQIETLAASWMSNPRWQAIERPYGAEHVVRLRGSGADPSTRWRVWAPRGCGGCCMWKTTWPRWAR
jgi:hypothetical protein